MTESNRKERFEFEEEETACPVCGETAFTMDDDPERVDTLTYKAKATCYGLMRHRFEITFGPVEAKAI